MATLEKIRSKSVLLIVVIGVALLAFIIGDAITNSRNLFGDQTTVAKMGGVKVDYNEYLKKREELNNQLEIQRRQNPYVNPDVQTLSQMALDQLIDEGLIDKAVDNAGIRTSSSQLNYYILEAGANPKISEIIQQLNAAGYGVSTPTQAWNLIFNPKPNGVSEAEMAPFQNYWVAMEQETAKEVARYTYARLLQGTIRANVLDKKALYDDYVATSNVALAFKPYENYNNEKYNPTEAELRDQYNSIKAIYKVEEPTKDIAFIAVSVAVSDADKKESSRLASETASALKSGSSNINKELRKEGVVVTHKKVREKDIANAAVKEFIANAPKDSVKIISDDIKGFTVVKAGSKISELDSVQINIVQVLGKDLPSKAMQSLNAGLSIDSVSVKFPADSIMVLQKEQWLALYNAQGFTGAIEQAQLDTLLNAGGKYVSLLETEQGALLAKITSKGSPKTIYEFDEVTYELKPSTQTVSDARARLEDFLAANQTAKSFVENASKEGYAVRRLSVDASTPAVPRMAGVANNFYPDSRQVVRWVVIDGKPGKVSHVYESKDAISPALYAAAVISEYDDYIPLSNSDVNTYVSNKVKKSKEGDDLMQQYTPKASSMQSLAQAMGVQATNDSTFRFSMNSKVRDAAVIGKITGSKPGQVVLVKGDDGVYGYQVISNATANFPYTEDLYEQQYMQLVNPDISGMLRGSKSYKNNIYKFEAGD